MRGCRETTGGCYGYNRAAQGNAQAAWIPENMQCPHLYVMIWYSSWSARANKQTSSLVDSESDVIIPTAAPGCALFLWKKCSVSQVAVPIPCLFLYDGDKDVECRGNWQQEAAAQVVLDIIMGRVLDSCWSLSLHDLLSAGHLVTGCSSGHGW